MTRESLSEYRRKRDFALTAEPDGDAEPAGQERARARFVIQKHAASHLHFDLRLEIGGVMKSWAVPKGPSLDPAVRRLAIEVEDHPIEYNTFEGTIPKGQYGGGAVMLWDRGVYWATERPAADTEDAGLRRAHAAGKLEFTLEGERLRGAFALVRGGREVGRKAHWFLLKKRDTDAEPGSDIVAREITSVETGRTMEEIAGGTKARAKAARRATRRPVAAQVARAAKPSAAALSPTALEPMLASVASGVPEGDGWVFEPKYDGIRVLAHAGSGGVHLMTRNGKDKALQFPEIIDALKALVKRNGKPLILDGEIVAVENGDPARFQSLQSRMHATSGIPGHAERSPAALIAFDLLRDGDDVLLREPFSVRRARLVKRLRAVPPQIRLGDSQEGSGQELLERARAMGWEGLMAKRADAPYQPGRRSPEWLKLKLESRQEFVVGGFTEPRNSRQHIGSLLLGYFDGDRLIYAGHAGGGFSAAGLRDMYRRLAPLERKASPFAETPKTNERAHWVTPKVVVEVKFNEWTNDGKLRQPVFLGIRDDKEAREVGRERPSVQKKSRAKTTRATRGSAAAKAVTEGAGTGALLSALTKLEESGGAGQVPVTPRHSLTLSSLDKLFFPEAGFTKGDLMRYYARVAPAILPVTRDRPLVLKRFPNGVTGKSFFQQNAPDDAPPAVRVETVTNEEGERQRRFVGGDLPTILYSVQLGSISVDPWHGRVSALEFADYTILDLDPGPRAAFQRVIDVARWVRETMESLGLQGALKTSGSRGLHIYLPLPPRTSHETALLVAQLVATRVAERHPLEATVERAVKARKASAVYVDYLQNIRAKTVSAAYAARARPGATVSTPLKWSELTDDLDPGEFTIETVPGRLAREGDLWAAGMKAKNSLRALIGRAPAKRARSGA